METIVKSELLASPNVATAEEEDVMPGSLHSEIGIATVVNEFGAATAHGTVHVAVPIQTEKVKLFRPAWTPHLLVADLKPPHIQPLACIFQDLAAGRNRFSCEYADAMNSGTANPQVELGESGVNCTDDVGTIVHVAGSRHLEEAAARDAAAS